MTVPKALSDIPSDVNRGMALNLGITNNRRTSTMHATIIVCLLDAQIDTKNDDLEGSDVG